MAASPQDEFGFEGAPGVAALSTYKAGKGRGEIGHGRVIRFQRGKRPAPDARYSGRRRIRRRVPAYAVGAVKHYLDAPPRRKRIDAAHPRQRRVKPEPGAVSVSRGDVSGDPLGTTPTDTAPPSLAVRLASDLMGEAS